MWVLQCNVTDSHINQILTCMKDSERVGSGNKYALFMQKEYKDRITLELSYL